MALNTSIALVQAQLNKAAASSLQVAVQGICKLNAHVARGSAASCKQACIDICAHHCAGHDRWRLGCAKRSPCVAVQHLAHAEHVNSMSKVCPKVLQGQ